MVKHLKKLWRNLTQPPNGNYGNPEHRIWIDRDGNASLNLDHPEFKKEIRHHIKALKQIKVNADG